MMRFMIALCALAVTSTAFAESWEPTDTQKKAVLARAMEYFTALDEQDYETAYEMLTPSMQRMASAADFGKLYAQKRKEHGAAAKRKIAGVSWYPKGSAVGSGVAAAIDFSGITEPGKVFCGYVAFVEMKADHFLLLRDDTTYFSPAMVAKMDAPRRTRFLDRPGCRQLLKPSR